MRHGVLLDLAFFALALITLVGWVYFWVSCIKHSERILRPVFGQAALGVSCVGFPFVFFGLLLLSMKLFGRDAGSWFFVILGLFLPALGIWAIKAKRLE